MDSLPWTLLFVYFMCIFIFYLSYIFFLKKIQVMKLKNEPKILKTQYWNKFY